MAELFLGCSGFTYPHWRGTFYPEQIPQTRWFHYYCEQFASVELNVTFYHLPKPETFVKWRRESGDHFIFALKGSRFITHIKRLMDPEEGLERFFTAALNLETKLGVVLWQFPPGFSLELDRLSRFLSLLDRYQVRNTFEFRHASWLNDDVVALCREHQAALCLADHPEFLDDLPPCADFIYIRRHGYGGSYDGRYSLDYLKRDSERITEFLRQGKDVYIYFNNDLHGYAPMNATELRGMLTSQ